MTDNDASDTDDVEPISELFVSRTVSEAITNWMTERAAGGTAVGVTLLRAPPGYGKTWTLRDLARQHIADRNPCFVVGPIPLTEPPTISWYERKLLRPVERRIGKPIPFNPDASVGKNVAALVQICCTVTNGHLVLLVDELDRAPEPAMELAEREVLSAWLNSGGSVIVGLRYNRRFHIRELRNPQRYRELKLPGFERTEARAQLVKLRAAAVTQGKTAPAPDAVLDLTAALPQQARYAWDIPAVNRCLWEKASQRFSGAATLSITAADLAACAKSIILHSAPTPAPTELVSWIFDIGTWPRESWSLGDLVELLGRSTSLSQSEASMIIKHLLDLNMIERSPEGSLFYRMDESWRRLLCMHRHFVETHS